MKKNECIEIGLEKTRKRTMKIGKQIKKVFGYVNEVDFVQFVEMKEHIIAIITSYDGNITHKQVNAVLNNYSLGHWIFIESRVEPADIDYNFNKRNVALGYIKMVSVYRVDKDTALQKLKELNE